MTIERLTTHVITESLPTPFGMSQWYWRNRASCLVEIETTDGVIGWGECFGPAEPNRALIESTFADLVIGADPWERITLWESMYNASREWGRSGLPIAAISGIEIALWDIAGKQAGRPVYQLLGGHRPESLPAYASGFYYGGAWQGDVEAEAAHLLDQGYEHVKMKVGANLADDIERVHRARTALGDDVRLAVDANRGYTPSEAVAFGRAAADLDLWFFEEPVIPEDRAGYREVRAKLDVPIAGGESEYT